MLLIFGRIYNCRGLEVFYVNRSFSLYLVTGAAGYLGGAVVRELVLSGKKVRALVLPGDRAAGSLPAGVETVYGDITVPSSLEPFFSGDMSGACLIHCAGTVSISSRPDPLLRRVNVDGTRNILALCLRRGVSRSVYVSSVHAIPEMPLGCVISEPDFFDPCLVRGHYAKTKAAATRLALAAAKAGLDISIVHPSGLIGPHDPGRGSISSAVISFCRSRIPLSCSGGYDFADVRDVAAGITACAEKGRSGECYILSGRYASLREIFAFIAASGYGPAPVSLPLRAAKLASPLLELASALRRRPPFITPYSAYTLGSNSQFSHEKASAELGYSPRPLSSSLQDTLAWLSSEGLIPPPQRAEERRKCRTVRLKIKKYLRS